jgi:hypothetical protein
MNRQDIYRFIDEERERQDRQWRTGRPSEYQYQFAAPHVLLLEEKVAGLRSIWYRSRSEDLQAELLKIAALAVRALEEIR